MPRHRSETTRRMTAQVAWLYYQVGLTQRQIAERVGVSRVMVAKLLAAAHRDGIVRISVASPYVEAFELERRLCAEFGLAEALVVADPGNPDGLRQALGIAAAAYLERVLGPGDVLGTAWGQTVHEVARQLHPGRTLPDLVVVQMVGGLSNASASENPANVAQLIAEKYGGRCVGLFAPAVVDSKSIRETITSDRGIERTFETARGATKALVGVGPPTGECALARAGLIDRQQMDRLVAQGAVGDIVGRYYDADGRPVRGDLDARTVGLDLDELRRIPCVIGVAGGCHKASAILGALRGGYLDVLVTDEETATRLVAGQAGCGDA